MIGKVLIEKLPYTKEKVGPKRWEEERGEFVQISYKEEIRHLALFEIKKEFSRGSHYHEVKEEIFYVASGKMRALFIDMDNSQKEEFMLEMGDRIRIRPRCAHVFYALEDTLVVEYSPQIFDPQDSYRVDLKKER